MDYKIESLTVPHSIPRAPKGFRNLNTKYLPVATIRNVLQDRFREVFRVSEGEEAKKIAVEIGAMEGNECLDVEISNLPDSTTRAEIYAVLHSLNFSIQQDSSSAPEPQQKEGPRETLDEDETDKLLKRIRELEKRIGED